MLSEEAPPDAAAVAVTDKLLPAKVTPPYVNDDAEFGSSKLETI